MLNDKREPWKCHINFLYKYTDHLIDITYNTINSFLNILIVIIIIIKYVCVRIINIIFKLLLLIITIPQQKMDFLNSE